MASFIEHKNTDQRVGTMYAFLVEYQKCSPEGQVFCSIKIQTERLSHSVCFLGRVPERAHFTQCKNTD